MRVRRAADAFFTLSLLISVSVCTIIIAGILIMSNYDLMYADKFSLYGGRNDRHKGIFHA